MRNFSQKDLLQDTLSRLSQSEIVSQKTKQDLKNHSERIKKLINSEVRRNFDMPVEDLSLVYKTLKSHYHEKNKITKAFFSRKRNIKKLIVALNLNFELEKFKIIDSQYYSLALEIIFESSKFKKSYIPIILRVLFESWDNNRVQKIVQRLRDAVPINQHNEYVIDFPSLKYILSNDCFFFLLSDILEKNIRLSLDFEDNGNILSFLKQGAYYGDTQFFHRFIPYIVGYILRKGQLDHYYYDFESTLNRVQDINVSKRTIPLIIQYLERKEVMKFREKFINLAYNLIGNPSIDAYWIDIDRGEESEINALKNTQMILKKWLANKFLTVFFNNLASNTDDDRREYWLKYVDSIVDYKILTNKKKYFNVLNSMNGIPKEYVKSKVARVVNNNKYIFILKFTNKTIIEFSTKGNAALVYDNEDYYCPTLNNSDFDYYDFSMPNLSNLIFQRSGDQIFNIQETGRLFHNEGWESFMDYWIKNHLELNRYETTYTD